MESRLVREARQAGPSAAGGVKVVASSSAVLAWPVAHPLSPAGVRSYGSVDAAPQGSPSEMFDFLHFPKAQVRRGAVHSFARWRALRRAEPTRQVCGQQHSC